MSKKIAYSGTEKQNAKIDSNKKHYDIQNTYLEHAENIRKG